MFEGHKHAALGGGGVSQQRHEPKQTCLYRWNFSNVGAKTPGALMIN